MKAGIMCSVILLLIFSLPGVPVKADPYLDYEAPTRDTSVLNQGLPANPEPALKVCAGVGAAMKSVSGFGGGFFALGGIYPGGGIPWYIRALST
jgi:hypothetical protein